jgi:hypothetical protein
MIRLSHRNPESYSVLQKYHVRNTLEQSTSTINVCAARMSEIYAGRPNERRLIQDMPVVHRSVPERHVAKVAQWNSSRRSSLMSAKDRLKQPFEFSSVAFVHAASNARTTIVLRSQGVLEDGMEHHAQALLALSISAALCLGAWIWARRRSARLSDEPR